MKQHRPHSQDRVQG